MFFLEWRFTLIGCGTHWDFDIDMDPVTPTLYKQTYSMYPDKELMIINAGLFSLNQVPASAYLGKVIKKYYQKLKFFQTTRNSSYFENSKIEWSFFHAIGDMEKNILKELFTH